MGMRHPVRKTFIWLSAIIVVLTVVAVVYFNILYNLMDRTEITGNPTIAESDLADPDDLLPLDSGDSTTEPTEPSSLEIESRPTSTQPSIPISSQASIPTPSQTVNQSTGTSSSETSEGGTIVSTEAPTTTPTTEPTLSIQSLYPIKFSNDVYNILLVGTDTRGEGFTGRSDAMMILSVNRRTRRIHLVSLIRGLYVAIEGHDRSMLNNAYAWGGSKLLLQTIRENFRIQIDDYVVINFTGFRQAIDIVGGVEVKLTQAEVSYLLLAFPGAQIQAGSNLLNGDLALCYARIRKIDSDYRRTSRQRTVIESLINKLEKSSAGQLDATVRQLLPLVKTNLSRTRMISLAVNALKYKSYPIRQLMIPIAGTYQTILVRGIQMTQYDEVKNVEALQQFLYYN